MALDAVFNGNPTTPNVFSSGDASLGIDVNSGQLYFRSPLTPVAGWQPVAGSGGGTSDDVTNESAVSGATVTDALNTLNSGGSGLMKSATVTLSAAQVIAIAGGAQVQIVPPQGAGTLINVLQSVYVWTYAGTPFANTSGLTFDLGFDQTGLSEMGQFFALTGSLDQTNSTFASIAPAGLEGTNQTGNANLPLFIIPADGTTGALTGGDGSTLAVTAYYFVVTL
jgi:hypothetical protein